MSDLSAWNVLIVDDEVHNSGVLEYVLKFHDAKVRIADSGAECLRMIEKEHPTLILLDLSMPKMSGWEVLKVIRDDDALKHIPVITITAQVMAGDRERALEAGFDGYIPKPISVSSIVKTIQEILRTRGSLKDNVQISS
jgi:two-component system, cell cycle response regulator DivK